jgi:hypothetical protein
MRARSSFAIPLSVLLALAPSPLRAQAAASPTVTIQLGSRQAQVIPTRQGFTHTGGGNIDVAQPAPDTVVITMTGVAVAGGHPCKASFARMQFDLLQCFEVRFADPKLKQAKLTLEGRVIGLLRTHKKGDGTAAEGPGKAAVNAGSVELLTLCLPDHSVGGGDSLSINDHEGPVAVPILTGKYTLHQTFDVSAEHPHAILPCKAASSEFAPDPALDPLWISYWEPFHGAIKKDFGFQITLKVAAE